ncbi:MAG: lipopolysaccharide heptosyltransferase II [Candidatus Omnitrophota bacterium]
MAKTIDKILFITLSNIGDVILTLPALDYLKTRFPSASLTVMVGPRPKDIFLANPLVSRLIIYDKRSSLRENIALLRGLRKEKFDMVIDLRNSLFGLFLPSRYKIPLFLVIPRGIKHMRDVHLFKVMRACPGAEERFMGLPKMIQEKRGLFIRPEDERYIQQALKEKNISTQDKMIILAPGARSHIKRWNRDNFSALCRRFLLDKEKLVLAGDEEDKRTAQYIEDNCSGQVLNLCGRTNLIQLALLLKKASLLITNDSAVMHMASYLNIPVVAVFGPTDDERYGPWSDNVYVAKKEIICRPCRKAQCRFGTLRCMQIVNVEDVSSNARAMLTGGRGAPLEKGGNTFKRILIVRTDRIGDVLLSTPVIKALRQAYPQAFIAMMVSPYTKDIIEGNPWLDEVIIYDKEGRHKGWLQSLGFAFRLKEKGFDAAIVLHPTNRVHLLAFFAAIPRRIGYGRKLGFLLTDRIRHIKQQGDKHELEYNLDLIRYLGIEPKDKKTFMPIQNKSEAWVKEIFLARGIKAEDRILVIHPGASCPSKRWPPDNFSRAADNLIEKYGFKAVIIAGPKDAKIADAVAKNMRHSALNLSGGASVSQLASVLKRASLFISNDSGPVHIASSLDIPVISIFGRNQPGLSPRRWQPLGKKSSFLHKDVGCQPCLAHNCQKGFLCLKAIRVEDVLQTAESLLK